MELKSVASDFFHDVVDEEVPFEFFFQDKNLVFDEDAVVIVKAHNFVVISEDEGVVGAEDSVGVLRGDFTVEIPEILFDFEDLGVLVLLEFQEVEQTNCGFLFLVNVPQNIHLLHFLVLFYL